MPNTLPSIYARLQTYYVPGHGHFTAQPRVMQEALRMRRRDLEDAVLSIYDGQGHRGDKRSHWRGYTMTDLAAIYADGNPVQDSQGRIIGSELWHELHSEGWQITSMQHYLALYLDRDDYPTIVTYEGQYRVIKHGMPDSGLDELLFPTEAEAVRAYDDAREYFPHLGVLQEMVESETADQALQVEDLRRGATAGAVAEMFLSRCRHRLDLLTAYLGLQVAALQEPSQCTQALPRLAWSLCALGTPLLPGDRILYVPESGLKVVQGPNTQGHAQTCMAVSPAVVSGAVAL
jgi:hypothetical protein